MGFETQEQAEAWAENMEQRAKERKEERLLASTEQTLGSIKKLLVAKLATPEEALDAAYKLGVLDGQIKMASIGIEKASLGATDGCTPK